MRIRVAIIASRVYNNDKYLRGGAVEPCHDANEDIELGIRRVVPGEVVGQGQGLAGGGFLLLFTDGLVILDTLVMINPVTN